MNKLRTFVLGGSTLLFGALAWALLTYGVTATNAGAYVRVLAVAVLLPVIPRGLAVAKYVVGKRWEARQASGNPNAEEGAIFVSESTISDVERTLSRLSDAISAEDEFDGVSRDVFSEGPGLTARHAGFHNSFIRVTGDSHLAITGETRQTNALADVVERTTTLSLRRKNSHPFREARPVQGAPRMFLGLFLVVLLLFGVGSVATAGYPADTYNTGERVVLVGFDVRSDVTPGYDETDATLGKSAFLVGALGEEAVEISWDGNATAELERHASQSLALSATVTDNLGTVRRQDSSAAQAERVAMIRSDLRDAECRVSAAIGKRLEEETVQGNTSDLRRMRTRLRERAASIGAKCSTQYSSAAL